MGVLSEFYGNYTNAPLLTERAPLMGDAAPPAELHSKCCLAAITLSPLLVPQPNCLYAKFSGIERGSEISSHSAGDCARQFEKSLPVAVACLSEQETLPNCEPCGTVVCPLASTWSRYSLLRGVPDLSKRGNGGVCVAIRGPAVPFVRGQPRCTLRQSCNFGLVRGKKRLVKTLIAVNVCTQRVVREHACIFLTSLRRYALYTSLALK